MARSFSVGDLARRSGVAVSTLHFYEQKGLIRAQRSPGNQRRYEPHVVRRVAIIRVAQELGISLAEIGAALARLPDGRTPTRQDWEALSAEWGKALDRRIARLTALRDGLSGCIGCGCLSTDHCPLRNPDDRLGAEGPGARLLRVGDEG